VKGLPEQNLDFEEVTIKVPKSILDILKDMQEATGHSVEEYLTTSVVEMVESQLVAGEFCSPRHLVDKYDLKPTFESYDVLSSQY
jgi:hypothetical protein